jgi:hypothetical protein
MTFATDEMELAMGNGLNFNERGDLFEQLGHEILLGRYQQLCLNY